MSAMDGMPPSVTMDPDGSFWLSTASGDIPLVVSGCSVTENTPTHIDHVFGGEDEVVIAGLRSISVTLELQSSGAPRPAHATTKPAASFAVTRAIR